MNEALEWCVVVWNYAGAPAAETSVNWTAIAAALISGSMAIGSSLLLWGRQARRENHSVRAAILAEIEALIDLIGRHGYLEDLYQMIDKIQTTDRETRVRLGRDSFEVRFNIPKAFNHVYQANAQKLGVLSEEDAKRVVRFYQLMDSVRTDTSEGGRLYNGTIVPEPYQTASFLLFEALDIGNFLIGRPNYTAGILKACGQNVDV